MGNIVLEGPAFSILNVEELRFHAAAKTRTALSTRL
jgi:hypothetical protein